MINNNSYKSINFPLKINVFMSFNYTVSLSYFWEMYHIK